MVIETFYRPFLIDKNNKLETLPGWTGYKKKNPLYYYLFEFLEAIKKYKKDIVVNKYLMYDLNNTGELDLYKSIKFTRSYLNNLFYSTVLLSGKVVYKYWINLLYKTSKTTLLEKIFNKNLIEERVHKKDFIFYDVTMVNRKINKNLFNGIVEKINIELKYFEKVKQLELTFENIETTKKQLKELSKYIING